jgi:hypothetical protein
MSKLLPVPERIRRLRRHSKRRGDNRPQRDLRVDFRRQVSLSKRTLARSGEAAPGLLDSKGVLAPLGV